MENTTSRFQEAEALFNEKRYTEALHIFKELADGGDSVAQYYAAILYSGDYDANLKNRSEAYRYSKLSADGGYSYGVYCTGYNLMNGIGCKKDSYIGAQYLKKAIDMGVVDANNNYGITLLTGDGVNKSISTSI
ncbi:MAG: hypothetical protein SNJ33_00325 [Rikenellaceae bacterium]